MGNRNPWRLIWLPALLAAPLFAAAPALAQQEECLKFDFNHLTVVEDMGSYGVADNETWIINVGGSRPEARVALHVMQHYRMDEICYVGGDRSPMMYLLANRDAPNGRIAGEDCIHFDNSRARIMERDSGWALTDGSDPLMALGPTRANAEQALAAIRQYNFNEICFIGRPNPSMIYFLR